MRGGGAGGARSVVAVSASLKLENMKKPQNKPSGTAGQKRKQLCLLPLCYLRTSPKMSSKVMWFVWVQQIHQH